MKNPHLTFVTEESLLNPEFQSTFCQICLGEGKGAGRRRAAPAPAPPVTPTCTGYPACHLTKDSLPPAHEMLYICLSGHKAETLPQNAATKQPKPNPV